MTATWIAVAVAAALAALVALLLVRGSQRTHARAMRAVIVNPSDSTSVDTDTGAVRSLQAADLFLPERELAQLWTPASLERLARTYWRFLTHVTLGLIRVHYTERERFVVLLFKQLKLLTFQAPEYEMDAERGIVRWRIEQGLLVARAGRGGSGYLQIDVTRRQLEDPAYAQLHIEVEVANFYPAIASRLGRWIYNETQSRIHVIVTHGFLRSLARLDLAESRVGRFARIEDLPDPPDTSTAIS
ncbi:MAG TPA: hypothetical protein VLJ42_07355 [Solirubrobacteraceae bacterium]|nr:hypothetical protein [Solirubrobacteraceae bacterium]